MSNVSVSTGATRAGGWALVAAAISFIVVFGYLAARFGYPAVLDGRAADVLPRLVALGPTGRAVWFLYALIPLLLIPAGIGAQAALGTWAPNAMRMAGVLSVVAALSMLMGLGRWPTIHWELAWAWDGASADARAVMESVFDGLNLYLGNFIGEFMGEIALSGFVALTGYALIQAGRRRIGTAGLIASAFGFVAALRNVNPAVSLIANANNYVLPLWLIVLGIVIARTHRWSGRQH